MTIPPTPPRGLRWTDTATARGFTTVLAILAIIAAIALGIRQQLYINCVAEQQRADAVRTSAIAVATDVERDADRRLLAGPVSGGPSGEQLRRAAADARERTDAVRTANPPPTPGRC